MDDANQLRFRNGELTAEVRMLNGRLADANNANCYLLSQVALRANDQNLKDIARLERQHKKTLRENLQLRAHLGLTSKKNTFTLKGKRDSTATTITEDSAEDFTDDDDDDEDLLFAPHGRKLQQHQPQDSIVDSFDSLVDLSEHEALKPEPAVNEEVVEPIPKAPERPMEIGYGLMNLTERTPRPEWEYPEEEPDRSNAPYDGKVEHLYSGPSVRLRDGTYVNMPLPFPPQANPSRPFDRNAYSGQNRGGYPFTDGEHNHLSGNAFFIEDLEGHELTQWWNKRARDYPKHTADEWRQYYEEKIRPAYLKKMKLRAEASVENSPESSQEITMTPASTDTGASFKTQISTSQTPDQTPVESIEHVEALAPSVVTAVQHEQSSDVEAEVNVASKEVTPSVDSSYFEVVPELSKSSSPVASSEVESTKHTMPQTTELTQEDSIPKITPPAETTSTVEQKMAPILEPLSGLSAILPHLLHRQNNMPSAFHQVVAGSHPAQASDFAQQKATPQSRFMKRNIIPAGINLEPGVAAQHDRRQTHTGRPPHPDFYRRDPLSREFTPSTNPYPPDSVEDLFAKPAIFHADPVAFRSLTMSIPPGINLATALSKIHFPGATLFSSAYFETSKMKHLTPPSTSNHIILIFTSGTIAQEFLKQQQITPIQHFCPILKTQVPSLTTLIPTATRPIPTHTQRDIFDLKLTRVLWILSPDGIGRPPIPLTPEAAWRALVHSGAGSVKTPLHAYEDADQGGKIFLEFASMREAKMAWERVDKLRYFFGHAVEFGFGVDSCGEVVEEGGEGIVEEPLSMGDEGVQIEDDEDVPAISQDYIDEAEKLDEADIAELRAIEDMEGLACGDSSCNSSEAEEIKTEVEDSTTSFKKEGSENEASV